MRCALLAAAMITLITIVAQAGVVITVTHTEEDGAKSMQLKGWFDEHRFRFEADDALVIFRGDQKTLWIVDREKNSYQELTEAQLNQMKSGMKAMMSQMQAQLDQLPADQRAQMEKMMGGNMPGSAVTAPVIRSLGKSEKINGFKCEAYEVTQEGEPETRVWTTDAKKAGLKEGDLAVLGEFAAFLGDGFPSFEAQMSTMLRDFTRPAEENQLPGFPIRIEQLDEDSAGETVNVSSIKRTDNSDDLFVLPDGLEKMEMDFPTPTGR